MRHSPPSLLRGAARRLLGGLLLLGLAACAEPVKDINRVQPNLIAKGDLEGEWYMLQTVVDVPATSYFTFIGETSVMERVRWELQEDLLIAYRSYERVRGAGAPTTQAPFDGKESPIAAYRVLSHVDIRREYNSSTGEQSNVISENTTDRPWFDRDYVRVDWSASLIPNFEMIAPTLSITPSYFEPNEKGGPNALYREDDESGVMKYFDVTGRYMVEPDEDGCIYALYYLAMGDCASAEISIRTSFSRVPAQSTYEPFQYDDPLMSRFGYFRNEYYEYDEQRGARDAGRRNFINRHDVWERSYDEGGRLIPIKERVAKAIPYYLNDPFPEELRDAAQATMRQWNGAFVRGLEALSDKALSAVEEVDGVPQVLVLCSNPVREGESTACGPVGTTRRMGDLRYSTLHWVDTHTMEGLFGYGPAATDPITGEIVSGKAYIYGAAINIYASYALDVIRYFSDQTTLGELINGDSFSDALLARLSGRPLDDGRVRHAAQDIQTFSLKEARAQARPRLEGRRNARADLTPHDSAAIQSRIEEASARRPSPVNAEVKRALESRAGRPWEDLPDAVKRLGLTLSPERLKRIQDRRKQAIARTADLADLLAPDVAGIIKRYAGRYDREQEDALWSDLRAEIFSSTAEHEVGHTLGLRHNFQGSYDSVNYPDEYWALRAESLAPVEDIGGFFKQNRLTPTQSDAAMRQMQYSSIMDYGFAWQSDINGIGKYDEAAIIFGYTSHLAPVEGCEPTEGVSDSCARPVRGLVEVFKKTRGELGCAGHMLDPLTTEERAAGGPAFECDLPGVSAPKREYARDRLDTSGPSVSFEGFTLDDPGLPSISLLERYHYTSFAQALPSLEDLTAAGRELMLYEDFLAQRDQESFADRKLRVPYLFCSDEWESALISCHMFDHGADPYELVQSRQYSYQAYYPFVNFRRDRPEFEVWDPLFNYFYRDFLPLSDIFQGWYIAPYGFDDLFDTSYEAAISAGVNLLMNVLATPTHGTFCENDKGELIYVGDNPVLQNEAREQPDCKEGGRLVYLPPGEGRRHFSTYDPESGYQFELKPEEAGHYWATLAAVWALFDTEAYLIGLDGDAGVYSIGFFDWFDDVFFKAFGDMLTDDYQAFGPRALPVAEEAAPGQPRLARLRYMTSTPFYGYDPLTGLPAEDPVAGPLAGPTGLCEPCDSNEQCAGYTGFTGGVFCGQLESGDLACLQDCSDGPERCPDGTTCDEDLNCVPGPAINACVPLAGACDADHPLGRCPNGSTCRDGECYSPPEALVVQSDPTFMIKSDVFWYGFIYTTSSFSTRFNDQLNVFRPGTPGAVVLAPDADAETVSFTDPESGVTYAAVQARCAINVPAASVGLCGSCDENEDCAGFVEGLYGEVFCVDLDGSGRGVCVQDCTEDEGLCGGSSVCDAETGNCVPRDGSCEGAPGYAPLASQCALSGGAETMAARMVRRGQQLVEAYQGATDAYVNFSGDDQAAYDDAVNRYYRDRFYLRSHVELIETLRATYDIFGKVY
jgi:hypothetical protein